MLIFLGIAFTLCIGGAVVADTRRRTRQEQADDLEAARLRLAAAGEDVDATGEPYTRRGTVYTSSAATAVEVAPIEPPADARIVEMIIDPTLTDLDVATAVEHVAPGVGSLASFAAAPEDTRMRTSAELHELREAEAAAYADAPAEEDRLFFAGFNLRLDRALANFDAATARANQWEAYQHRDNEHHCEHCLRAAKETSDEYRLIRSLDDTGAISRADIEALYAAHAVAA